MNTSYLLLGAFALVALTSIVLAVLNWVQLANVSAAAVRLESEVDKKAREFDTLRKERASTPARPDSSVAPTSVELDESAMRREAIGSGPGMSDKEIEIVRNVRPRFEEGDGDRRTRSLAVRHGADAAGAAAHEEPDSPERSAPPVRIALYSQETGGADLQRLYSTLSAKLPGIPHPRVVVDLDGVAELQDPQIAYLARVCGAIQKQDGRVAFVRSAPRLRAQLSADPTLAPLLR